MITPEERAEMAAADAEIEDGFCETADEIREANDRDFQARIAEFNPAQQRRAAYQRNYREANREKKRAYNQEYYQKHKAEYAAHRIKYRQDHPGKTAEYQRKYDKTRKETMTPQEASEWNKKQNQRHRAYIARDPEKWKEYHRKYRQEHKEQFRQYSRTYRQKHLSDIQEYDRKYNQILRTGEVSK